MVQKRTEDQFSPNMQSKNKAFWIGVVGTIAATISAVSLLPQVRDTMVTKDVNGLSLGTIILILVTSILWLTYHFLAGTYHGTISSAFTITFSIILIVYIVKYKE